MRVLHLVKTAVGATWALRQMRELVQYGVEVHAALPSGPMVEKYQAIGVVTHLVQTDLSMRQPLQIPEKLRHIRELVSTVKPDIIHSHFVGTTLAMRLALGRKHPIPRVFQVPGPLHLENEFFRRLEIGSAGSSDYWIGSCRWTCDCYRRSGISDRHIFLSYYGTDIEQFVRHDKGKLRKELGIADDVKLVGMVAYMYAPKIYLGQTRGLKGHEDLIDAITLCRKDDPRIMGVFVGGAWNGAENYEKRVRAYGKERCADGAIFLGTRHDIPDLYPDFSVAVHPSHSENVGGVVESLLMAVPTIATNVGGFPDLVINEKTGWLVEAHNSPQLAKTIMQVIDNTQAQEITLAGQQLTRELFDVKRTAREVLDVYHMILEQHA